MPKKKDKKKRGLGDKGDSYPDPSPTFSEGSVMDSSEEQSENLSSLSSPPSPLTSTGSPSTKGRGFLSPSIPSDKQNTLERRRSEMLEKEQNGKGSNRTSSPTVATQGKWDSSGHRRSNPSISSSPFSSSGGSSHTSSSSLASSSSSAPLKKKKTSFFSPNVLANHPAAPPPSAHKGLLTHFNYKAEDMATIVRYLVCLHIRDEKEEIACFFCAFSNFGICKIALFLHLKQLFEEKGIKKEDPDNQGAPVIQKKSTTRQAISYLLKVWMALSSALYDLQFTKLFQTVVEFVRLDPDPSLNPLRLMLIKGKKKSDEDSELPLMRSIMPPKVIPAVEGEEPAPAPTPVPAPVIDKDKYFQPKLFCKGKTVLEVANTLTFVMFRVFKSIGPAELHDGAWQGKNKASTGPHLHALSLLFNRIAFLCVVEILYAPTEELRADSLLKCIELAEKLEKMNNFEGMAAVTSVFSTAPIQRLKPVWSAVGSKMAKKAKKLEELLQPVKNYKAYNNVFRSREAPIIPWLAPKLRELRFMYDGNNIKNQDGTVDYDFLLMMGKSIHNHLKFKDMDKYEYKDEEGVKVDIKEDLVTVLEDVNTLDQDLVEDTLYEKSMSIYTKHK